MFSGPYNTPLVLGRTPIAAVFWPLLAPILFVNLGLLFAGFFTFGWAFSQFEEGGSLANQWMILLVIQTVLFAAMSAWCQWVGAGPFAGSLPIDSDWAGIAALTGPIVLLGTTILTGILVGGDDPNWMFRESPATDLFSRQALGLSMVAASVFLFPITEEVAFRGIALGCLLSLRIPPVVAALVTAAVFAGTHLQYTLFGMLPVFITGLYFAFLRIATGTISAPILAHISANGVSLMLFAASNPPS